MPRPWSARRSPLAWRCGSPQLFEELPEPRDEFPCQVGPLSCEHDHGPKVVQLVACVEAPSLEQHAAEFALGSEDLERVGQLDLPAASRRCLAEYVEDLG